MIEQADASQYLADQQKRCRHQQQAMLLTDQEHQGKQQVEEHLVVQGPADIQGRVLAIAPGVFRRDEQQRQDEMLQIDGLMRHPLACGQQQQSHQCRVEPVGRHDTQRPVEQETPGLHGLVAGREVDHQAADDEEHIHPDSPAVDQKLADRAAGMKVEKDLHEVMTDHHPGGKRP
ncbi:hypothetical protein D3C77_518350 [compost metagenome]